MLFFVNTNRWWNDLGLAQELTLARNEPLNWYLFPMAGLTDPSLSEQRIELTKPIALIFLIDDIFDVYGKLDELILFTEEVNRYKWIFRNRKNRVIKIKVYVSDIIDILCTSPADGIPIILKSSHITYGSVFSPYMM